MIKAGQKELFELVLLDVFKLKKRPVTVFSREIHFNQNECYGLYSAVDTRRSYFHKIRVSRKLIKTPEQLFALMAHEYVHAWQVENSRDLSHDEASKFEYWTNYFQVRFNVDIVGIISWNI